MSLDAILLDSDDRDERRAALTILLTRLARVEDVAAQLEARVEQLERSLRAAFDAIGP